MTAPGTAPQGDPPLAPPVRRFLDLTEALTALLARENALLENRRPRETKTLQGEKLRLTAEYKSALEALQAEERALLGPPESSLRRRIRSRTERFRAELARHARLVIRLKTLTEGMVRAISEEAMRQRGELTRYGGNARVSHAGAGPAALTLDTQI